MKINICTGYPLDSPKGNTVTARRLERLLAQAGHDATAIHTDAPPTADIQISLHAFKTAAASIAFKQQNPDGRLFVYLTGTDLHGGIDQYPKLAQQVLGRAERLIVAQAACLPDIPEKWQSKTTVIHPSIELPELGELKQFASPLFTNVGHLRPVKNPNLIFHALQLIDADCLAVSLGVALDRTEGQQALLHQRQDKRYRWIADCDRAAALGWMQNSTATINSSFSEGGANTVLESIHLGVPVLASDIAGNRGFLGEGYQGYFESNQPADLAKLMLQCMQDADFLGHLTQQTIARRPFFTAENEIASLLRLLSATG